MTNISEIMNSINTGMNDLSMENQLIIKEYVNKINKYARGDESFILLEMLYECFFGKDLGDINLLNNLIENEINNYERRKVDYYVKWMNSNCEKKEYSEYHFYFNTAKSYLENKHWGDFVDACHLICKLNEEDD